MVELSPGTETGDAILTSLALMRSKVMKFLFADGQLNLILYCNCVCYLNKLISGCVVNTVCLDSESISPELSEHIILKLSQVSQNRHFGHQFAQMDMNSVSVSIHLSHPKDKYTIRKTFLKRIANMQVFMMAENICCSVNNCFQNYM
jgi:hypothetical protein